MQPIHSILYFKWDAISERMGHLFTDQAKMLVVFSGIRADELRHLHRKQMLTFLVPYPPSLVLRSIALERIQISKAHEDISRTGAVSLANHATLLHRIQKP